MIKYLDKVAFPKSYIISDASGKHYRSIDDWILAFKKKLKNKHTKKKYKYITPYLYIINTSPREDMSKYFKSYVDLTKDVVNKMVENSDKICLEFSWDFSEIIFITFSYGLNNSYIDPKVYYDGFRLDTTKAYTTNYRKCNNYGPCIVTLSNNIVNMCSSSGNIILSYMMDYCVYRNRSKDGVYIMLNEVSTIDSQVPLYHIEKYTEDKRIDNKFNRYIINFYSNHLGINNGIRYVDAVSENAACNIFIQEKYDVPYGAQVTNIIELPEGQWF